MTMEIYDWPAEFRVRENSLDLETMGRVFESPFDGSEQTVATPGSKWLMELTMGKMEPAVARRLEAFIAKLDGKTNRVRLWDFAHHKQPVHGAPIVSEALNMRTEMTSRGWKPSTLVLRDGDWLQGGGRTQEGHGRCLVGSVWRGPDCVCPHAAQEPPERHPPGGRAPHGGVSPRWRWQISSPVWPSP